MNELQHISEAEHGPIFVTLNPPFEPDANKVAGRYKYDHPIIDAQVGPFAFNCVGAEPFDAR